MTTGLLDSLAELNAEGVDRLCRSLQEKIDRHPGCCVGVLGQSVGLDEHAAAELVSALGRFFEVVHVDAFAARTFSGLVTTTVRGLVAKACARNGVDVKKVLKAVAYVGAAAVTKMVGADIQTVTSGLRLADEGGFELKLEPEEQARRLLSEHVESMGRTVIVVLEHLERESPQQLVEMEAGLRFLRRIHPAVAFVVLCRDRDSVFSLLALRNSFDFLLFCGNHLTEAEWRRCLGDIVRDRADLDAEAREAIDQAVRQVALVPGVRREAMRQGLKHFLLVRQVLCDVAKPATALLCFVLRYQAPLHYRSFFWREPSEYEELQRRQPDGPGAGLVVSIVRQRMQELGYRPESDFEVMAPLVQAIEAVGI